MLIYQLVLYPVKACANLNRLYVSTGKNRLYAAQGRALANDQADSVKKYFEEDSLLANYYNTIMSRGKWNHMMDQTHIGYTYWQQPEKNAIPDIKYIQVPDPAEPALAIEGSASWWPHESAEAVLPEFDSFLKQSHYVELFNRGTKPFEYSIKTSVPWIKVSGQTGSVEKQERIWIEVDWQTVPAGIHKIPITITPASGNTMTVFAIIKNYKYPSTDRFRGFVESDGYVSMEAGHYTRAINQPPVSWQLIPEIGRTGSGNDSPPGHSKKAKTRVNIAQAGIQFACV